MSTMFSKASQNRYPGRVEIARRSDMTSYKLSRLVTELESVRGIQRAVLRVLADRYPNIWPSVALIAEEAGFGTTQVRKALRNLETAGFISEVTGPLGRTGKRGGRMRSTQYRFDVEKLLSELATQGELDTERTAPLPNENPDRESDPLPQNPTFPNSKPNETAGVNATRAVEEQRIEEQRIEETKEIIKEEEQQSSSTTGRVNNDAAAAATRKSSLGDSKAHNSENGQGSDRFFREVVTILHPNHQTTASHREAALEKARQYGESTFLAALSYWLYAEGENATSLGENKCRTWVLQYFLEGGMLPMYVDKVRPFADVAQGLTLCFLVDRFEDEPAIAVTKLQAERLRVLLEEHGTMLVAAAMAHANDDLEDLLDNFERYATVVRQNWERFRSKGRLPTAN